MPDVVIALIVIVTLLGAYVLGWLRHSRRHTPARWHRHRRWLRRFDTLGDGYTRGPYRGQDPRDDRGRGDPAG